VKSRDEGIGLLLLLLLLLGGKRRAPPERTTQHADEPLNSPDDGAIRASLIEPHEGNVTVETTTNDAVPWMFPVPTMVLPAGSRYVPQVSSGFGEQRATHVHKGQDILYPRIDGVPEWKAGDHGTRKFWAPAGTPIVAARGGKVWSTSHSDKGWMVVLDHGKPWATMYLHLDTVAMPEHKAGKRTDGGPAVLVDQGAVIGTMGWSHEDGEQIRHLHFEVWDTSSGHSVAVNPAGLNQNQWGRKQWQPTT